MNAIQKEKDPALDTVIRRAVEMRLFADGFLSSRDVTVHVEAGVVSLQGVLPNLRSKDFALQLAGQVRGVREIRDRLQLKPNRRLIAEIEQDLHHLIAADSTASRLQVRIKVTSDASVILSGKVPLWGQKQMVAWIVEGVSGVQSISNQIEVTTDRQARGDLLLASDIRKFLRTNSWLFDSNITVTVKDQVAKLNGFVASLGEKQEAYRMARIPGVKVVDLSELQVDWYGHNPPRVVSMALKEFDEETSEVLLGLFAFDPRLASASVRVTAEESEVILEGTVDQLKSKVAAEQIVQNVVGVRSVQNRLQVKKVPVQGGDRLFEADGDLSLRNISVSIEGDEATLRGSVADGYEASLVVDLVSRVAGVGRIRNELKTLMPIVTKSGRELEERLRLLIFADPIVPAGVLLQTKVRGELVEYSGQVSSLNEESLVIRDALIAGARQVEPSVRVARGVPKLTKRYVVSPVPMNSIGWSSFSGTLR